MPLPDFATPPHGYEIHASHPSLAYKNKCYFIALPNELITTILELLNYRALAACSQVCRRLHTICTETVTLRYDALLSACGMRDGPPGKLCVAERLELLMMWHYGWTDLEWTNYFNIRVKARGLVAVGNVVLYTGTRGGKTECLRLPSMCRAVTEKRWDLPYNITDILGVDPSQDLIIVWSKARSPSLCLIEARSLSTGEIHPEAGGGGEYTILPCSGPGQLGLMGRFQIYGNRIATAIRRPAHVLDAPCTIWICDWKDGSTYMHIDIPQNDHTYVPRLRFLSADSLACVCAFSPLRQDVRLRVYHLKSDSSDYQYHDFDLPAQLCGQHIYMRGYTLFTQSTNTAPRTEPFYPDEDRDIIIIACKLREAHSRTVYICVFARTLLSIFNIPSSRRPARSPWNVWRTAEQLFDLKRLQGDWNWGREAWVIDTQYTMGDTFAHDPALVLHVPSICGSRVALPDASDVIGRLYEPLAKPFYLLDMHPRRVWKRHVEYTQTGIEPRGRVEVALRDDVPGGGGRKIMGQGIELVGGSPGFTGRRVICESDGLLVLEMNATLGDANDCTLHVYTV
ncbi:hypothetical protein PENSPDRAFT_647861 [Peniophora sp. CONT]|nr:hypothetical protein PENSPDRAFT_647861 [Peniophora sp. CONT]